MRTDAVAVAEVAGADAGLALVDALDGLDGYHPFHAVRGELLARASRFAQARAALLRAADLAPSDAVRAHLRSRARQMEDDASP